MAVAKNDERPVENPEVVNEVNGYPGEESTALTPRIGFGVAAPEDTQHAPVAIDPPWLSIVHPVGTLGMSGKFLPGSLVLGKEYLVAKANEHLKIVVWDYITYFKEYLSIEQRQAGNTQARTFLTEAEAHKAGLTTVTNPVTRALPTAPMAMTWVVLIEQPKDLLCDLFFLEIAGKRYAPAKMGLDKSAFVSVKNSFFMAAQFTTRAFGGIKAMRWDLWTRLYEARTGNKTWVPSITPLGIMPEEERKAFQEAASAFGGAPQDETPAF